MSFIGCGALGIMYASLMLQHLTPEQVRFIADPARVERYRNSEFYANSDQQRFRFVSSDEAAEAGPSDLVILTVKSYGLDDAIELAQSCVGPDTLILSFLNGISSEEAIARAYGPAHVVPCIISGTNATRTEHTVWFSSPGCIFFGPSADTGPRDLERLARLFESVAIPFECKQDIMRTLWWKFMLNVGVNQVSALLRAPYALLQSSSDTRYIVEMAMREVCELSVKRGIDLGKADIDEAFATIDALGPEGLTSMCQDIVAHRRTEVDIFAGMVMRLGRELDVSVPINTFLFHAIKALEEGQAEHLMTTEVPNSM